MHLSCNSQKLLPPSWIWSSKIGWEKYKDKLKGKSNKERGKLMEDKFKLEDKETIDAIW